MSEQDRTTPSAGSVVQTLRRAARALQDDRAEQTQELCARVLERFPDQAAALSLMGQALHRRRDYPRAAEYLQRATQLNDKPAGWHFHLAIAHHAQQKLDEAVACYQRCLELDPQHVRALMNLAAIHSQRRRFGEAVKLLQRVLRVKPDHAEANAAMGQALIDLGRVQLALPFIHKALQHQPESIIALCAQGNALRAMNRLTEAADCYQRILRINPKHAVTLYNLGVIRNEQGRLGDAIGLYQRALRADPKLHYAWVSLANARKRLGDFKLGLEAVKRAKALAPDWPDVRATEASIYEMAGEVDKAWACIQPLVERGSTDVNVVLPLARIAKKIGRVEQAITALDRALADPRTIDAQKLVVHFAYGKLLDSLGRYDQAFEQFRMGNEMKPRELDRSGVKRTLSLMRDIFSPEKRDRLPRVEAELADADRPIFIVGMPRSGTTLVEQMLASHPQVHGAGELRYMGFLTRLVSQRVGDGQPYPECAVRITNDLMLEMAQRYLANMRRHNATARRVVDKMPNNFWQLGLISRMLPKARIIHTVRDPMDTCLSCYFQNFGGVHAYAFNLANLGFYYRQYARMMAYWKKTLDLPILTINYEQLVAEPETHARKLIDFVGLEWDERVLAFHETRRDVATASYDQVRRPIYADSIGRWRHYEKHLAPLRQALSSD